MLSRTGSDLTRTNYRFNPKENKQSRYLWRPVCLLPQKSSLARCSPPPSPFINNCWEHSVAPKAEKGSKALCYQLPFRKDSLLKGWVLPPSLSCTGLLQVSGKHWVVSSAQQDTGLPTAPQPRVLMQHGTTTHNLCHLARICVCVSNPSPSPTKCGYCHFLTHLSKAMIV